MGRPTLNLEEASRFADLALKGIGREYPNKLDHVINDEADVRTPRQLHPAFYGCFDWHSSVHGHWMLVRLLRLHPKLPRAAEIRAALTTNLSEQNILAERAYLEQPNRRSFERTYGWAWLLKLAEELYSWAEEDNDAGAGQLYKDLQPLSDAFVARYLDFLPRQVYPVRTGTHPNTAFGLLFALDYARTLNHRELESLVVERSLAYFSGDTNYPASWEPGGSDFISPALVEADLMRRVLPGGEFREWLGRFLPDIASAEPESLFQPALVTDRTDPQIVHLDGLNLSRAWCMHGIASALSPGDPRHGILGEAGDRHAKASLPHIASGDYMGEHWLASFAVYLLSYC
ncbi:MAG TPA: DUF2891 domain-containing protein [Chloroflexia bacterium]|jgi:hypothetical protein